MQPFRPLLAAALLLAGLVAAAPAAAHGVYYGGRGYWAGPSVRFHFGYYGGPLWWPPAYYAYPAPYVLVPPPAPAPPAAPPVYIEREPAEPRPTPAPQPGAPEGAWWYFCPAANGFYPYVRECPSGWERVPALPPGQVR